jgi:CubicO group peptidase (beta-lactamase class C family)
MTTPLEGSVALGFEGVQKAFEENFKNGSEVGASFCAYQHGTKVVDLWGGYADKAKDKPWQEHSLANVWSTTKGMTAMVIARLVEQGKVSYDEPVVTYWPEFGQHGKDKITVGQMLSHQAGVSALDHEPTLEDYCTPHLMAKWHAEAKPLWEPGSQSGYHAMSYGWLAGELAFRVTGKTLGSLFAEEVAAPLDADFYIGLPEDEDSRAVEMVAADESVDSASEVASMSEIRRRTLIDSVFGPLSPNERRWRAAEIPAAGGQANAAGIAVIYGALAQGGKLGRVNILQPETIDLATKEQINSRDLVLDVRMSWGSGFVRNVAKVIYGPNPESFGHSGFGGSLGFADPVAGLGVGYAMNQMGHNLAGDQRSLSLIKALYQAVQ